MRTRSLLALALVALAAVPAAGAAVAPLGEPAEAEYAPGQVIVQFAPRARADVRADALAAVDGDQVETLGRASTVLVEVGPGETVEQAVARLEAQPGVVAASPNWVIHGDAVPNDPRFGELWGLANAGQTIDGVTGVADADVDAPEAWDLTTGSSGIVVAVIDTGIAYDHPDLASRIFTNPAEANGTAGVDDDANGFVDDVHGWDFVGNDNDPRDLNGHGTHTAGTIGAAGNDGGGVTGVAQDVRILPLRILGANNSGFVSDSVKAINYARAMGARIASGSYGGGPFTQAERDAIAAATGTLFVFSAGNDGRDNDRPEVSASDRPNYPCSYDPANIVCVAATDQSDGLASFSNVGATTVDVGAPGVNVLSDMPAYATFFADDFESGLAKWTTGGTNNTWGTQAVADATSPSNVLADSPAGSYVASTSSFVRTAAPVSLAGQVGCRLTMQLRIRSEISADGVIVETSTNGTTFSTRTSFSGFTTNNAFRVRSIDLSLHDGAPSVWLGFRFTSDADATVEDGVQIDDVAIRCLTSTYTGTEFQLLDGTSMAAPHVSGVAALALAFEPTLTPAQLKANLLAAVDPIAALAGKTVTGGRVNAYRTLLKSDTAAPTGLQASGAVSGQTLAASWAGASDRTGIDGYSVVIDTSPTTAPDAVKDVEETATGTTSGALAPGAYFVHVLAIDNAGNVGAPVHAGPFTVAAPPPPPPAAPLLPPNATLADISGGVALAKDNTVGIKLRCNALATGGCSATVTLTALVKTPRTTTAKAKTTRVAIGSGKSTVLPGATRTLKVKVNKKGIALFAKGPQSVEVKIVSTDGSGAKRTFTKTFRLKRPK